MAKSDSHARDAIPSLGAGSHAAGARPIVRLLIISDHERHRSELGTEAEQAGFDIRIAPDASRAIESDRLDWNPDAVLLDQLLPRSDQYAAIRALRSAFGVPAFVVSDAGDAAYPFDRDVHLSPRQQIIAEARLFNAVVTSTRRYLTFGDLKLDTCTGLVTSSGRAINLSRDEATTLSVLIMNQGTGVSRRSLASAIGVQRDLDARIVDVHVVRLMVKLGDASAGHIERTPDRQGFQLTAIAKR